MERGHACPMPLGFATHHPGGIADNSPTFQRWDLNSAGGSPEGTAETMHRVSRPFGTYARRIAVPNVETLGYCRKSLRDKDSAKPENQFGRVARRRQRGVALVVTLLMLSVITI